MDNGYYSDPSDGSIWYFFADTANGQHWTLVNGDSAETAPRDPSRLIKVIPLAK